MFRRILVAVDNSALAQHVFDKAVSLAKATDARLMLLHVLSPSDEDYSTSPEFPDSDSLYPTLHSEAVENQQQHQWKRVEQQRLELLQLYWETATIAGVLTEFTQHLGSPSQIICHVARTWNADLLVMGCRRRSSFKEQNSGSVSNYITHHASCSILTVQHPVHTNLDVNQIRCTNRERLQKTAGSSPIEGVGAIAVRRLVHSS